MAISLTISNKVNNTTATTSVAFPAFSSTLNQVIFIGVAMADTTQSVLAIGDTAGTVYLPVASKTNGTSVKTEFWYTVGSHANAFNVITVTFTGATLASAVFGEYAGATGEGGVGNNSGNDAHPITGAIMSGSSDWVVAAFGFASNSGDTATANQGNLRQTDIPALTTTGILLMDNTSSVTTTLYCTATLSAARAWAGCAFTLTSGSPPVIIGAPQRVIPSNTNYGPKHQAVAPPANSTGTPSSTSNTGFAS